MDAMIRVVQKGMLTTIQDQGRRGYQRYGVSVSGAMDWIASGLANTLVGNSIGLPLLESTVIGPVIDILDDCCLALTGAIFSPRLDGVSVPMNSCIFAPAGSQLALGTALIGARGYIAFSGGLDVGHSFGSASTDMKAGLGGIDGNGATLRNGDCIGVQAACLPVHLGKRTVKAGFLPPYSSSPVIRIVTEARLDYFAAHAVEVFTSGNYTITNNSDRMGYRLEGPEIPYAAACDGNTISDGVAFGSIQVAGGKPIILMADHQTIGGYTKLGAVIMADLPLMAQLKPGDTVSFKEVSLSDAQEAYKTMRKRLGELARLLCEDV